MKKLILLSSILLSALTASATEGALKGKFTINAGGDQIVFSQGNLQYFCSTTAPEWRFAEHQYDYVPFDMSAYAANSEKWIDLFAHGTSGYDNGQTNYQPYIVGADPNTYYQGNLTGNADWGYNAISNGGNTENFGWRTLTRDEWIYLFSGRTNAASRYGHGSINGINGMILLPDNWTTPDGLSFTPGNSIWTNSYTLEQWNWMQKAGAVFLPASGSCNNVGIPSESLQNQNGFYRAGTAAYYVYFAQGSIQNCTMSFYQYGDAVRLVQAAPACNIPPTDIYETACDSFPWLGTMYYASGDISKTFKAVNGCDSVVTLHLTINNSNTGEEYKTAESSYEWHGTTYTASGDYTYTLTNVAGCDSVATLHLTITPPPPVWENGALPGKFTINSNGDQIVFSQGNLQYRATTDTWRFAIYQYDMIGADNTNISATYDGWIDLIQWGAGNNPTTTATYTYNTFVEFGSHAISNGGNVADAWRTMTNDEWVYIFHGRANAEDRVGLGSVNGITGVIILPDTWTTPDGLTFNPGPANGLTWQTEDGYYKSSATDCFSHNTYTSQQWGTMESSGAVFLPAAGDRYIGTKSIQQLGTGGYYWSSTKTSSTHAYIAAFGANILNPQHNGMQDYGQSVRLVQAAPKPAQPSWVLAGDTWDEATKTLTVNSNPGERAYQHKTDIVNLIFSDGVTNIGTYAFLECTSLISITFANTLTEIGIRAFDYCNNLPSVEIPNSVETIGEGAFYFCQNLISLTIGNNVKTIGEFAFYGCYALNSITIPNSVETIGKYAFLLAKSATSLTIGNSVKSIGEHAFYRCYALTSITIPGSVESIDKDAFGFCTDLTSVTCEAVNPPAVGKGIFSDSDKLAHIYVPAGSVANYKTAANWSDYAAIIEAIPGFANITVTWDAAFIDYVEAFNHLGTIVHYDNSKDGITVTYSGPASNIGKGMQSYIVKLTTSDKLTFTSTVGDIKKIEITYTSMSGTAPAGWTANDPTLTWEGTPAAAVELPGAIELPRITSIVFIVDKTATAIEEISQQPTTNSQKLMIDGQLIIERDGKFFNAQGAQVR